MKSWKSFEEDIDMNEFMNDDDSDEEFEDDSEEEFEDDSDEDGDSDDSEDED